MLPDSGKLLLFNFHFLCAWVIADKDSCVISEMSLRVRTEGSLSIYSKNASSKHFFSVVIVCLFFRRGDSKSESVMYIL